MSILLSLMLIKLGIDLSRTINVCSLIAAFDDRNGAQENRLKQKIDRGRIRRVKLCSHIGFEFGDGCIVGMMHTSHAIK